MNPDDFNYIAGVCGVNIEDFLDQLVGERHNQEEEIASNHMELREILEWGTYGETGEEPLTKVKIMDMSRQHIEACLKTQNNMHRDYRITMQEELKYRESIYNENQ